MALVFRRDFLKSLFGSAFVAAGILKHNAEANGATLTIDNIQEALDEIKKHNTFVAPETETMMSGERLFVGDFVTFRDGLVYRAHNELDPVHGICFMSCDESSVCEVITDTCEVFGSIVDAGGFVM